MRVGVHLLKSVLAAAVGKTGLDGGRTGNRSGGIFNGLEWNADEILAYLG